MPQVGDSKVPGKPFGGALVTRMRATQIVHQVGCRAGIPTRYGKLEQLRSIAVETAELSSKAKSSEITWMRGGSCRCPEAGWRNLATAIVASRLVKVFSQLPRLAQPRGAPLIALQHTRDLLPECLDRAAQHRTPQSPHLDPNHDRPPVRGHICQRPQLIPVHLAGQAAAARARGRRTRRPRPDDDHAVLVRHVLDDQRRQPGEHDSRKPIYVTPAPSCAPSPIVGTDLAQRLRGHYAVNPRRKSAGCGVQVGPGAHIEARRRLSVAASLRGLARAMVHRATAVVIAREFARPWRRAASLESGQDLLEAGLLAGLPTKAVQGYT